MFKKLLLGITGTALTLGFFLSVVLYWVLPFFPSDQQQEQMRATNADSLDYLNSALPPLRGKILAIVTSVRTLGHTAKPTGYELSELARAYWVFSINGFRVDIASPEGGEPYALLDDEDMGEFDYAFLNDAVAQYKMKNTVRLDEINPEDYVALYFVGGKGAMFDFPDNPAIHHLLSHFVQQQKTIAAVCHGPAALVNVKDVDGNWLVANKRISAFTNAEELLLIPEAQEIFPFLLQSKLEQRGARFIAGANYLEMVVRDNYLITGQNPWSVWLLAEETVKHLGYEPLPRTLTAEEHSVALLQLYQARGLSAAETMVQTSAVEFSGQLVLLHAFVAFMSGEIFDMFALILLADSLRAEL